MAKGATGGSLGGSLGPNPAARSMRAYRYKLQEMEWAAKSGPVTITYKEPTVAPLDPPARLARRKGRKKLF